MRLTVQVGSRVWIDPVFGYEQTEPAKVRAVEAGSACVVGFGWFDLGQLTVAEDGPDPDPWAEPVEWLGYCGRCRRPNPETSSSEDEATRAARDCPCRDEEPEGDR